MTIPPLRPTAGCARSAAIRLLVLAVLLLPGAPALAQETYRLEEQGWEKQQTFAPDTPEGQLQAIRRTLAAGRAGEAQEAASRWVKRYPAHRLVPDALLLRGDARVAAGNEYKALYVYEQIIRQYPASDAFNTALEREFRVAQAYAGGAKRKFMGMRILPAGEEAEEIFIRIQERAPGSDLGERASMALGDYYYRQGEMDNAAEAYGLFLINYPRSEQRERAMRQAVEANLASFRGPRFDATGLIEGAERLRQYQQEFPAAAERFGADALLVRINESLALKEYQTARWYRRRDQHLSSATMHRRVVRDYSQTAAARASMNELTEMGRPVFEQARPTGSGTRPSTQTAPAGTQDATAPTPGEGEIQP